jgi:hypothetical protein
LCAALDDVAPVWYCRDKLPVNCIGHACGHPNSKLRFRFTGKERFNVWRWSKYEARVVYWTFAESYLSGWLFTSAMT